MEINKNFGEWDENATELDDIAYHSYCSHEKKEQNRYLKYDETHIEDIDLTLISQYTFMFFINVHNPGIIHECEKYYEQAKLIIRDEKIKKIMEKL